MAKSPSLADADGLLDTELDTDVVGLPDTEEDTEAEDEGLPEMEEDTEAEDEGLPDREELALPDGELDIDVEGLPDAEELTDVDGELDVDDEGLLEAELDAEVLGLAEIEELKLAAPDPLADADAELLTLDDPRSSSRISTTTREAEVKSISPTALTESASLSAIVTWITLGAAVEEPIV